MNKQSLDPRNCITQLKQLTRTAKLTEAERTQQKQNLQALSNVVGQWNDFKERLKKLEEENKQLKEQE